MTEKNYVADCSRVGWSRSRGRSPAEDNEGAREGSCH